MNNKGFTLVELLAVIVVLSIVAGITFGVLYGDFGAAKESTEEIFVDTIKDAMDIYLSSDAKDLSFSVLKDASGNDCLLVKTHGSVKVEKASISMKEVIDSSYHPITQEDLVNPANDSECADAEDIEINIYRDGDFVYYYEFDVDSFGCLINTDSISTLPEGFVCR